MRILLNGQPTLTDCTNLWQLIEQLQLQERRFAVELNQQIIPKSQLSTTSLTKDDRIEIIHAVGGG